VCFVCLMNLKKDGTGCPFFLWEAGYINHLETEVAKEKAVGMQSDEVTVCWRRMSIWEMEMPQLLK